MIFEDGGFSWSAGIFFFMSHSVQDFFDTKTLAGIFFELQHFFPLEYDAGYFSPFTSCCRIFFTITRLAGDFFSKRPTAPTPSSKIKWLAPKIYCFSQFALSNNPVEPCNIYQKPAVKVAVTSDFADRKIANILTAASVFLLCKDAAILPHERS